MTAVAENWVGEFQMHFVGMSNEFPQTILTSWKLQMSLRKLPNKSAGAKFVFHIACPA